MSIAANVVTLRAPGELEFRIEQLSASGLKPAELLCETLVTAISPGTELAAYNGLPALRPGVTYPRVVGYCNVARVLAIGAGTGGFSVGDRVLSFASHRSHFVLSADEVLLRLDAQANADEIVCAYLFHLGYNAVLRAGVRPGSKVVVLGLGVVGLGAVAMAGVAGAQVYAVSEHDAPASVARAFGAREVYRRAQLPNLHLALTTALADVVITTSNSWSDWLLALQTAGSHAAIACLGFPGRGESASSFNPLDSQYFYVKQLRIEAVGLSPARLDERGFLRFNERENLAWIVSLMAQGRLSAAAMVSGIREARDIEAVYRDLSARTNSPLTYLLRWAQ